MRMEIIKKDIENTNSFIKGELHTPLPVKLDFKEHGGNKVKSDFFIKSNDFGEFYEFLRSALCIEDIFNIQFFELFGGLERGDLWSKSERTCVEVEDKDYPIAVDSLFRRYGNESSYAVSDMAGFYMKYCDKYTIETNIKIKEQLSLINKTTSARMYFPIDNLIVEYSNLTAKEILYLLSIHGVKLGLVGQMHTGKGLDSICMMLIEARDVWYKRGIAVIEDIEQKLRKNKLDILVKNKLI